jgi:hypothetical protein
VVSNYSTGQRMEKYSYKLDETEVSEICELLKKQERLKTEWRKVSNPAIAEMFNVSTSTIEYIKLNKMRKYAK